MKTFGKKRFFFKLISYSTSPSFSWLYVPVSDIHINNNINNHRKIRQAHLHLCLCVFCLFFCLIQFRVKTKLLTCVHLFFFPIGRIVWHHCSRGRRLLLLLHPAPPLPVTLWAQMCRHFTASPTFPDCSCRTRNRKKERMKAVNSSAADLANICYCSLTIHDILRKNSPHGRTKIQTEGSW